MLPKQPYLKERPAAYFEIVRDTDEQTVDVSFLFKGLGLYTSSENHDPTRMSSTMYSSLDDSYHFRSFTFSGIITWT